jgi:DNA-binding CsgD family transcriptional regulator
VYGRLGQYAASLAQHQSALSLYQEIGDRQGVAAETGAIGSLYAVQSFESHDPVRAEQMFLHAIDLATECGHKSLPCDIHQWLAELYRQLGRWEESHHHLSRHHQLKEELHSIEAHKKIQQFEHLKQIAEMEKQRAIEQAQSQAAEEMQRMKAEATERELGNATLQLLAQTELLRDLRNDLQKIVRKIPPSEPAARELRERIKNLACESVDWEKFDRQFRVVHPDFIRKLTERAPDLTPTEVRICTMLRMNLKSHEMAQIFCITEDGVEFHRRNIRRKLGLKKEEKLPIVLGAM